MTSPLSKPPIIELIAEMRWLPISIDGTEVIDPLTFLVSGAAEEAFYERFRVALGAYSFSKVDRLIPPGFAIPIHNAIYRHTRAEESSPSVVAQIGPGILSVHALPPYKDWATFRPIIENALSALLLSRPSSAQSRVFTRVSLRYLDVFDPRLMGGKSMFRFINEVLKLEVSLPEVLQSEAADLEAVALSIEIKTQTKSQMDLTLSVGPNLNLLEAASIIMDTMVATRNQTAWGVESALEQLDRAHESIHRLFFGLTTPIINLME
jgi:uncharacterized protein (TIGR04255 family)